MSALNVTADETLITPEMDRRNGRIFFFSYLMMYLSAPAVFIGVVQATLCDRLGTSAAVANLPAATYLFGQFAPLICSWLVPHRLEKNAVIWSTRLWAASVIMVLLSLVLPLPAWAFITALIIQGLLQGVAASVAQVYSYQCLGRGTTGQARARVFKWTYAIGPLGAFAGSLAADYCLKHHISWAPFPYNFALIYGLAAPCIVTMALLSTRWQLLPLPDEPRQAFSTFIATGMREYFTSTALLLLLLGYLLFNSAQALTPTLALHARDAMQQAPDTISGKALEMRFACKAVGGYLLGALALRWGLRASVAGCLAFTIGGMLWAAGTSGYWYLFAFGLMGMGELGGAYFPAYGLALSPSNVGPRNLSILGLAVPAASFAPWVLGTLKDTCGFHASLIFALSLAIIGLLVLGAIKKPNPAHVP